MRCLAEAWHREDYEVRGRGMAQAKVNRWEAALLKWNMVCKGKAKQRTRAPRWPTHADEWQLNHARFTACSRTRQDWAWCVGSHALLGNFLCVLPTCGPVPSRQLFAGHSHVLQIMIEDMWKDHCPPPWNKLPDSYSFLVKHSFLW